MVEDLITLVRRRKRDRYERIVVLGDRRFIDLVEEAFSGRKVRAPLAVVGGILEMIHEMNVSLGAGIRL
jgi:hypothetical protein